MAGLVGVRVPDASDAYDADRLVPGVLSEVGVGSQPPGISSSTAGVGRSD